MSGEARSTAHRLVIEWDESIVGDYTAEATLDEEEVFAGSSVLHVFGMAMERVLGHPVFMLTESQYRQLQRGEPL